MKVSYGTFAVLGIAIGLTCTFDLQAQTLDIYVIDVEGGNAVLFVSPSHESLLMDTGNVGAVAAARDAGRIVDAMKDAGLSRSII